MNIYSEVDPDPRELHTPSECGVCRALDSECICKPWMRCTTCHGLHQYGEACATCRAMALLKIEPTGDSCSF